MVDTPTTADESSELTATESVSDDAATTTTRTTFDELMQALSELEADDALPPAAHSHRPAPTWRESAHD